SLLLRIPRPPRSPRFPYTTLFRSKRDRGDAPVSSELEGVADAEAEDSRIQNLTQLPSVTVVRRCDSTGGVDGTYRRHPACRCRLDRKSTRLNSSHLVISYAVFCLK